MEGLLLGPEQVAEPSDRRSVPRFLFRSQRGGSRGPRFKGISKLDDDISSRKDGFSSSRQEETGHYCVANRETKASRNVLRDRPEAPAVSVLFDRKERPGTAGSGAGLFRRLVQEHAIECALYRISDQAGSSISSRVEGISLLRSGARDRNRDHGGLRGGM